MAQGYIVPLNGSQNIEDAVEEHFSVLLSRCFFKDVKRDDSGNVMSFKIHDLMHDVAHEVAGKEICVVDLDTSFLDPKVRHIFHSSGESREISFNKRNIRTYCMKFVSNSSLVATRVENLQRLRSLDLSCSKFSDLPDSIGELIHLGCLDLSANLDLRRLPDSVGRLHNLETLYLRLSYNLQVLPNTLSKLVKLRHLDIHGCNSLACMPLGVDKLTSLCILTDFVAGDENSGEKQTASQLEDLKNLVNARGSIDVWIRRKFVTFTETGGSVLERMKHLNAVGIYFEVVDNVEVAEVLMGKLKPHPNLRELNIRNDNGLKFADWGRKKDYWGNCLPNLVKIDLSDCENLDYLPCLSELKHLGSLKITNLQKLNSIEELRSNFTSEATTFFPSLETLEMHRILVLEGWWRQGLTKYIVTHQM